MKNLKFWLAFATMLLLVGGIFMSTETSAHANHDQCTKKFPKPWQIPDRTRCQAEEIAKHGKEGANDTIDRSAGGLFVGNKTNQIINFAIMYYDGSTWRTKGWYSVNPGDKAKLFRGPLTERYYYIYAESGSYEWRGNFKGCVHPTKAFHGPPCYSSFVNKGFARYDVGGAVTDYTINFGR